MPIADWGATAGSGPLTATTPPFADTDGSAPLPPVGPEETIVPFTAPVAAAVCPALRDAAASPRRRPRAGGSVAVEGLVLLAWVAAAPLDPATEAAVAVPGVETAAGVPGEPRLFVCAPVDPAEVVVVAALASGSWRRRPGRVGGSVAVDPPVLLTDAAAVVA